MRRNHLARIISVSLLASFSVAMITHANEPLSLDALLETVRQGRITDTEQNRKRVEAFRSDSLNQRSLLETTKREIVGQEHLSKSLEKQFENKEDELVVLEDALNTRLGSLKELFGVLQQASGDAVGRFENSITNLQFSERIEFLEELTNKMGQTSELASIEEIEELWYELQREIIETGKIVSFAAPVTLADGRREETNIIRVGTFNIISDNGYLQFVPETGNLVELPRQPQTRYENSARDFIGAENGVQPLAVDPSRGQLLSLLVQTPNLGERISQGGVIGYIILGLGLLAALLSIERLWTLSAIGRKMEQQRENLQTTTNNPLGRLLNIYRENPDLDMETLDLKLSEAVLNETPKLNKMLIFIKIIAVVAPLLGLLGTVTGMIITFQSITLFGTGDPKLMAGGISQALVTTVLGLCVAIPTVLLHTLASNRAKYLTQILEEQVAGLIATHAERNHPTPIGKE
jgi:biopolymer transport protein ExbB